MTRIEWQDRTRVRLWSSTGQITTVWSSMPFEAALRWAKGQPGVKVQVEDSQLHEFIYSETHEFIKAVWVRTNITAYGPNLDNVCLQELEESHVA